MMTTKWKQLFFINKPSTLFCLPSYWRGGGVFYFYFSYLSVGRAFLASSNRD